MNYENLTPIATSIGLGGITGFLLGYFIRKIIRIIFFAVGGILALLMYLQYQGVISVNTAKIESYTDEIVNTLSNTNSTIESWILRRHTVIGGSQTIRINDEFHQFLTIFCQSFIK
jgi:uncharacterized membrane protein (Fun14 family)